MYITLCFYRFFKLVKLGVVVVATFAACWWPFLQDKDATLQVLSRLFPFSRGLYEVSGDIDCVLFHYCLSF